MDHQKSLQIKDVFSGEALLASGSASSGVIDVSQTGGAATAEITVTGDGTIKLELLGSNGGSNYVTPNGVSEIATGLTKTPGTTIYSFTIPAIRYIKFKVTETGGANAATVSVKVAVR